MSRPLVLLDVDGVINDLTSLQRFYVPHQITVIDSHGFKVHIPDYMPDLIQRLVTNCEVYWCSTWRERANDEIAGHLGIPSLPVVTNGSDRRVVDWKEAAARPLVQKALGEGRDVYWIEDHAGYQPTNRPWDQVTMIDTALTEYVLAPHLLSDLIPDQATPA